MTGASPKESRRNANERRAAAQKMRQEQLAKERRRRTLLASVGVLVVLIVIGALVAVGLNSDKHGNASLLPAAQAAEVTGVPATTLDTVGKGTGGQSSYAPTAMKTGPLTENGKPKILFVGAEWCPYCAATRWPLAVALSRFGTFKNLGQVYSAADDGDLASLSFHGATYTSPYLVFDANEVQDRNHNNLDKLSAADQKLWSTYAQGYPFIDFGGKYQSGTAYDPSVITGMDQAQIAAALKDPTSPVAQAIDGSANVFTSVICKLTGNKPANVCTAPGVLAAAS